jgi:hypothetical protein
VYIPTPKKGDGQLSKEDFDNAKTAQTAEEALFLLIAQDMLEIAEKYKKDVGAVHKIFYEVSCDRDALIEVLEEKNPA